MDDDTGEMKVKEETISVAAHFFRSVQFFGFSGSSGLSHVTWIFYSISDHFLHLWGAAHQIRILDRPCRLLGFDLVQIPFEVLTVAGVSNAKPHLLDGLGAVVRLLVVVNGGGVVDEMVRRLTDVIMVGAMVVHELRRDESMAVASRARPRAP
jgi:hypothetical protein